MKFSHFLLGVFLLVKTPLAHAHSTDSISTPASATPVKPWRLAAAGGATVAMVGVPLIYMQNAWWSEQRRSFHFDDLTNGTDLKYAKNVDKAGHFIGGYIVADIGYEWLKWGGLRPKTAAWLGAGMGVFYQLSIEYKDAFAPTWGFSIWDLSAGTIGAFTIVGREYFPKTFELIDYKFSYYPHSNHYLNLLNQQKPERAPHKRIENFIDEYVNQMYWLDVNLTPLFNYEPKWYNAFTFEMGMGLNDQQILNDQNKIRGGQRTLWFSVGYDFDQLTKNWNSKFGKRAFHLLNYLKFPAPAIQVFPDVKLRGIYF